MQKMNEEQANLFLNKDWVKNFFNNNSQKIFDKKSSIEVLEIKRSKTLNPTSYNILYKLKVDNTLISLRAATSLKYDVDYNFNILKLLFENGFNSGDIQVAKPYTYFEEYNLMMYKDIPGEIFTKELGQKREVLIEKVKIAAYSLKRIHNFKSIPFHLWDQDWYYNEKAISKYFPELGQKIPELREKLLAKIKENKNKCLCHGDYSPDNLIYKLPNLFIIDWGSATFSHPEMDLACFVSKLEIMVPEFGNQNNLQKLIEIFLETYGEYDLKMFNWYKILYSLRILNSFVEFPEYENAENRMKIAYKLIESNLLKGV